MAKLPDELIERIKSEVSLVGVAESQGHVLKKQGKDFVLSCPFHQEDTPSMVISPDNNLFNCFGCGASGSVIDWTMKTKAVSFRYACELLQSDLGLIADGDGIVRNQSRTKIPSSLATDLDQQSLLSHVIDFYHETLQQSVEAQDYLKQRGLDCPELIKTFKLGYSNRTLGYRLPEKNRQAGNELRSKLQGIGIYRASGHEHFTGCLVVPTVTAQGAVTEVYGRRLQDKKDTKHLYLPGAHAGVFNEAGLINQEEVILCESLIDAMTFWVHGFRNVTASYGTQGFTDDHLRVFKDYGIKRVVIAYDNDDAGNRAAEKLAKELESDGFACFRLNFPPNMDANDFALKITPPQKNLSLLLQEAKYVGEGPAPARGVLPVDLPILAAKPEPATQASRSAALPFKENSGALEITLGERFYRIRGWENNRSLLQMKVQLYVEKGDAFHVDKLDLTSHKQRQVFINQASRELADDNLKNDLGRILLALEDKLNAPEGEDDKASEMTPEEREAAMLLLESNNLMERVLEDFNQAGVVGEESNKLVAYLAATSRKLEKPLAVMIQSSSAAGKSSLMDAVLAMMPPEETTQYSAMTGQSLFYMGQTNLKHKILAISEEEGASNASYALKLLQSEGQVTIASTGKDESSGELVTKEYTVEGPVMLCFTTTAIDNDEELVNRCLVLTVNEGRAQTEAIHAQQRLKRTLAGLHDKLRKKKILATHQNAQRLLEPLHVINPYAERLTFLSDKTRTRRDHDKYLTLIECIALLHQYQRDIKSVIYDNETVRYVEVTLEDIAHANRLAHEVLGRTLDELPAQTRHLLNAIKAMVKAACAALGETQRTYRFSRRTIREYCGWSDSQLKLHCKRLEELEYLLVHRGRRGQSIEYELLYNGEGTIDEKQFMGLIDLEILGYGSNKSGVKPNKSGLNGNKSGPSLPQVWPKSTLEIGAKAPADAGSGQSSLKNGAGV